jgi:hypothetical protein
MTKILQAYYIVTNFKRNIKTIAVLDEGVYNMLC